MAIPDRDPIATFRQWQAEAAGEIASTDPFRVRVAVALARPVRRSFAWLVGRGELPRADAAALATVTPDGKPTMRMVLVKTATAEGFLFYTSYGSAKGQDLAANPHAALAFHWPLPPRQVRVEGPVERLSAAESDAYWHTRPRGSQLAAAASEQSAPLPDRRDLLARVAELRQRFRGQPVPRPDTWGGYRLVPARIELWEGRPSRLHDRLRFDRRPGHDDWDVVALQP